MNKIYKDKMGRYRTSSLFVETNNSNEIPVYSLADEDKTVQGTLYRSAKKIYLSYSDPTEYKQAVELVGSWEHWKKLLQNSVIATHIMAWREELTIRNKSEAIEALQAVMDSQPAAAKYLSEQGYDKGGSVKKPRGRPKNRSTDEIGNDLARLKGLKVV